MEKLTMKQAQDKLFGMLDKMKYRRTDWKEYVFTEDPDKGFFKLKMWTNEFMYIITVSSGSDYMSCYGQSRKIKPGDREPKGNDLHSGRFTQETFDQIMKDIVSYELVSLFKKDQKPFQKQPVKA